MNLYGGPGVGKSTTAAGVFRELKLAGLNAEYVPEYAKDATWEGRTVALKNQAYVFGKQLHRLERLRDKVDVAVTDSPLLLGLMYAPREYPVSFAEFVRDMYRTFDNMDVVVRRVKPYSSAGRSQTSSEADKISAAIEYTLNALGVKHAVVPGDELASLTVSAMAQARLTSAP